jgi:hypothetical protein
MAGQGALLDVPAVPAGTLNQAIGEQDGGVTTSFGGLRVVLDPNISTTIATIQDEIYVLHVDDLILMEGPLRARVFPDVLSGTLQVRLQVWPIRSSSPTGSQPRSASSEVPA